MCLWALWFDAVTTFIILIGEPAEQSATGLKTPVWQQMSFTLMHLV